MIPASVREVRTRSRSWVKRGAAAFAHLAVCGVVQASDAVPPHCGFGEHVLLSAKLGVHRAGAGGTSWTPNGKIVSLCTDRPDEPFGRITYRYGAPGAIEMEEVASGTRKFHSFLQTYKHPNQGFFFDKGAYRYFVLEGTGMARGVTLVVYRNGKRILDLFSGTDDARYISRTHDLDVMAPQSPVLQHRIPREVDDL